MQLPHKGAPKGAHKYLNRPAAHEIQRQVSHTAGRRGRHHRGHGLCACASPSRSRTTLGASRRSPASAPRPSPRTVSPTAPATAPSPPRPSTPSPTSSRTSTRTCVGSAIEVARPCRSGDTEPSSPRAHRGARRCPLLPKEPEGFALLSEPVIERTDSSRSPSASRPKQESRRDTFLLRGEAEALLVSRARRRAPGRLIQRGTAALRRWTTPQHRGRTPTPDARTRRPPCGHRRDPQDRQPGDPGHLADRTPANARPTPTTRTGPSSRQTTQAPSKPVTPPTIAGRPPVSGRTAGPTYGPRAPAAPGHGALRHAHLTRAHTAKPTGHPPTPRTSTNTPGEAEIPPDLNGRNGISSIQLGPSQERPVCVRGGT